MMDFILLFIEQIFSSVIRVLKNKIKDYTEDARIYSSMHIKG